MSRALGSDGQIVRSSSATFYQSARNLENRTGDALRHAGEDKVRTRHDWAVQ